MEGAFLNDLQFEERKQLGYFIPSQLVYCGNLLELDISGCTDMDNNLFVDCVVFCKKMTHFRLTGCIQFTEQMLVKMLTNLEKLEFVDCSFCTPVVYKVPITLNFFWGFFEVG